MKRIAASILTTVITVSLSFSQTVHWAPVSSPTTKKLFAVSFSSPDTIIAVGDAGTIIRSIDRGVNWEPVSNPATDALRGVAFFGKTGLATGISGRVFRSENGGQSWSELPRFTHRDMFSVSMDKFVAVITGHEGYIYRSKDGGQNWEFKNSGTFDNLFGVSVYGTDGVAVGGQGAVAMTVDTARAFGLTVLGQNPLDLLSFSAVSMANDTLGWAVGYLQSAGGIVIKSGDAGFVWTRVSVDTTAALGFLWGVAALSPDFCTIVGSGGKIYNTTDHGRNWTEQPTGTSQSMNSVAFANETLGIAVGDSGTILKLEPGSITSVPAVRGSLPGQKSGRLNQNFPNPFHDMTSIGFTVQIHGRTTLKIFNTNGDLIRTLVDQYLPEGEYLTHLSGSDMAAGVYIYQLTTGNSSQSKRLILLK